MLARCSWVNGFAMLGDLPQGAAVDPNATTYDGPLVEAVKHFQLRHGLKSEGKLDKSKRCTS
jgi:murein L,D-transpeptidase YcbB/YkuD